MIEPQPVILVVGGVVRTMFGQVDVSNGNFMDGDLEFHWVSGCA